MKEKEYIVEKWFKISEIFDSKNKAIEEKNNAKKMIVIKILKFLK